MPDFSTKSEEEQKNIRLDESVLRAFYRRPPSPKNTTKGYLEKALEYQGRENIEALLKENLQFSDVRGYDLNRFGRLTAVLVGFFSDMQITILSEAESSFDVLGGKLQQSNIFGKYVFVYSKFPRAESRIVNVITRPYDVETINKYDFLKETPPGVNFSSVVELRDLESIVSGHAITFLNCNGEKFIYDDNVLSVIPIDWSVLFNPESNYDTLYYVITGSLPFLVAHFVNRDSVSEFIMLFPSGKTKQLLGKRIYTAEEKFTILKRSFSTKKSVFYLIEGFSFCISNFTGLEMPNENNTNTSAYWYNKPFSGGKRQFRAKRARRLRPRGTLKRRRPQKTRRR
jgi:hypothetical protein